jgi:hypothetical protein
LLWFGLGVALTALALVKGRQLLAQATPSSLAGRASRQGAEWLRLVQSKAADFNVARRQAEAELRRQHGLPVVGSDVADSDAVDSDAVAGD